MVETPSIQPLDSSTEPGTAGTKAATLADLARAGEVVPRGFVITATISPGLDSSQLAKDVERALAALGTRAVAVRSSATVEDLPEESHAGEYETVLGVSANASAVIAAAHRVVTSGNGVPMAVLVQEMIDADAAGAAFSANPVTGDDEVVVSAVPGLADRLMEGSVTGDEWIVRDGKAIRLSGKDIEEDLVLEVAALASRLADRFRHPVDIEWAHDGTKLHLLQCRPITALPVPPEFEVPEGSWQKDTTHYPGPVRPLAGSHIQNEADAIARWMERSGLILERFNETSLGGEIYVQPVPVGGGSGKPPPRFVMGIVARIHPGLRARMATAKHVVDSGTLDDAPRQWAKKWKPELTSTVDDLRAVDLGTLNDRALLKHIEAILAFWTRGLDIHFDLMLPYMISIHELAIACESMLGWDENRTLRLLSGHSPASSEATIAMRDVAEIIRRSPAAMASLDGNGDLVQRISGADAASGAAIADWTDRYAFRSTQYDWSSPTIEEQPGLIARMLQAEVQNGTTLLNHDDTEAEARSLLAPQDVAEFDRLLATARAMYPVREDNIHWTYSAPGALLRRAYLEVGDRLTNRGILTTAEDVFMLERTEAVGALTTPRADPHTDLVRRRRAERAWVTTHPGPRFLGDPPGAPPDIGAFPAAGRRLNQALLWTVEREFAPIAPSPTEGDAIVGVPGAAGVHTGIARIVRSGEEFDKVQPGDVVVCPITNPAWSVLFGIAGAFVCDAGGPLSHTAILTREYAIPSVLATGDATKRISDGAIVTVDGAAGTVRPRERP